MPAIKTKQLAIFHISHFDTWHTRIAINIS